MNNLPNKDDDFDKSPNHSHMLYSQPKSKRSSFNQINQLEKHPKQDKDKINRFSKEYYHKMFDKNMKMATLENIPNKRVRFNKNKTL